MHPLLVPADFYVSTRTHLGNWDTQKKQTCRHLCFTDEHRWLVYCLVPCPIAERHPVGSNCSMRPWGILCDKIYGVFRIYHNSCYVDNCIQRHHCVFVGISEVGKEVKIDAQKKDACNSHEVSYKRPEHLLA